MRGESKGGLPLSGGSRWGGIGIDLVEIARLERAWCRYGSRFLGRVYTAAEQSYCLSKGRPAASLAARFAAKEAVMKALGLGLGGVRWRDIEILPDAAGRPTLRLLGAAQGRAAELGICSWHLSLAHGRDYAVAVVLAERG
ncbi:MAG: holo-ACP synthase [Moorellales bacterium]